MAKHWIKGAIKHPGSLRRAAKRAGAMTKSGKVNLGKMSRVAKKRNSTSLKRKIALARNLKKMRK